MSKLRLLKTGHGDLCLAEWDVAEPTSVGVAEGLFNRHRTAGRMAFRIDGPGNSQLIDEFDPNASEILIVPAIQGG